MPDAIDLDDATLAAIWADVADQNDLTDYQREVSDEMNRRQLGTNPTA